MTTPQGLLPCRVNVNGQVFRLGGAPQTTLGRTPENDIVVNHTLVSRRHLAFVWRGNHWAVIDAGSTNGYFVNGRRLAEFPISGPVQLRLGDPNTGPVVEVIPEQAPRQAQMPPPHQQPRRETITVSVGGPARTIGRTPDNDIVVNDVLASRHHARLSQVGEGLVLEDLHSVNGTFVNGSRISRAVLRENDVVTIGNSDFVVSRGNLLRGQEESVVADGVQVTAVGLTVDGGKQLLQNVSFNAAPGTLTAIIGPSGAGKSTMSKIVAGLANPTAGYVTFEGRNVHEEYEALRTRIGMVPQDDVLHMKLTLREALRYAAELRLPTDSSKADRDQVIMGVLAELQLTEHLDTRVDKLSGGQRKRASVAMELLTGPSLLILDEPTSGLDPALDRQVMKTLRLLANAGRVVLVVTHSLSHLSMCDQVLLLAPGGKTAYCGSPAPSNVIAAMGTNDWAEIFEFVASSPDVAASRYQSGRIPTPPAPPAPRSGKPIRAPQTSMVRQISTIGRRQVRLIFADRGYLVFLGVLPLVLGLLTLVIPGDKGLSLNNADNPGEAVQILVVLVLGAMFMGAALTVRDLVSERAIYERERAVGLRPSSYLGAKIIVFFVIAVLQAGVMLAITYAGRGTPSEDGFFLVGSLELFVAIALLACVSALIGLTISAVVKSAEQTMPPLVLVVMVQLVFCAGLFTLAGRVGLEQLAWLFPGRWGYAASAIAVDLTKIGPLAPQTQDEPLWEQTATAAFLSYGILIAMGVLLVFVTYSRLTLKRKSSPGAANRG